MLRPYSLSGWGCFSRKSAVFHRQRGAAKAMEVHVETDQGTAGTFIHLNAFYVQCVDGEVIAVAFSLRWRCAAITGGTKIGAGLDRAGR